MQIDSDMQQRLLDFLQQDIEMMTYKGQHINVERQYCLANFCMFHVPITEEAQQRTEDWQLWSQGKADGQEWKDKVADLSVSLMSLALKGKVTPRQEIILGEAQEILNHLEYYCRHAKDTITPEQRPLLLNVLNEFQSMVTTVMSQSRPASMVKY